MKPFEVKGSKVLIFGDFHQDINWVKTILEKEKGNYDQIINLGDLMDSFYSFPVVATAWEVADFTKELIDGKHGPYYQIIGNHDSPILESYKYNVKYQNPKFLFTACSGYTKNKSKDFNKQFSKEYWAKFEPFAFCNGYLLSHAGIVGTKFWDYNKNIDDNLDNLYTEFKKSILDLLNTKNVAGRFFDCGFDRGGKEVIGGPTWVDFDSLLDDSSLPPQITGHSESFNNIRKQGRNYCLDGARTTYVILHDDGKLDLKSTRNWFHYSVDGKTTEVVNI